MNAIDILKKDHQDVQQLFSEFMSADHEDFVLREDVFQQIDRSLIIHTDEEEQIFYPAVQKYSPDLVKQALSDHHEIKELLVDLIDLAVSDEQFDDKMTDLIQKVQTHFHEEENSGGVLEIAEQKLNRRELDDLGRRILQLKKDSEEELAA